MRTLIFALLMATAVFAQQSQPPAYPPPSAGQMSPDQRVPPDQMESQTGPESQPSSAAQVEQEIQQAIQAQPTLSTSNISVRANDTSVVMAGTVADERQHQMALRVAALHASGLRIVDRIKVQQ
jgi:osmotically-inducible protein OsmY